jgi:hypothetical protein
MTIHKSISRRTALHLIGKTIALSAMPFTIKTNFLPVNGNGKKAFVKVCDKNNRYLELTNGKPYIPIGLNFCWPPFSWNGHDVDKTLSEIDLQLKVLSKNRGNFIRIWLSAAFFEAEQKAGVYDEHIAKRMDRVMAMAEKYNIRVKLCFEHFRKLKGVTPSHGVEGKSYDKPIYSMEHGGPLHTMEEYFTTETGKNLFIKRLEFYSKRYADNPYVFGVELWNEVECVDGVPLEVVTEWSIQMLKKQKELFPKHLSLQSFGSFESETKKDLFKQFYSMPGNEISQVHRYHLPDAPWDVLSGPLDITCANAIQESLSFETRRPVLLAEIGVAQAKYAGRSELHDLDKEGIILHDMLFAPFFSGATAPGHCWYWDTYVQKHDLWYHFDRFAESIKEINPIEEDFKPFTITHPQLRIYGLRGNNKTILWCRDSQSNMFSELMKKQCPPIIENVQIQLDEARYKRVKFYNPWTDKWQNGKISGMKIHPPSFHRSIIVILAEK